MTSERFHRPRAVAASFGAELLRLSGLCALIALGALATTAPAFAGTTVTYTGQGFNFDGTTYNLNDERCGAEGQGTANDGGTGQFADWNGSGMPYETGQAYLVWVLTANGATSAKLNLPAPEGTVDMFKVGGTFKFASDRLPALHDRRRLVLAGLLEKCIRCSVGADAARQD